MEKDLETGQILQVELSNEILVGRLVFYDNERRVLILDDVKNIISGYSFTGSQILSLSKILSIRSMENDGKSNSSNCSDEDKAPVPPSSNLSTCDIEKITEQMSRLQYITQSDCKYHDALKDIKSQPEISICLEPSNCGRNGRTSLVIIATHNAVYIFDMQTLGRHWRKLREVLELKRPRKVVHCSNQFVEQLRGMGVKNGPVTDGLFDTFVAYCLATRTKKPSDLTETIHKCFNIPPKFLEPTSMNTGNYYPYRRPLNQSVLEIIAKRAILQLKLYEYLLHDKLLSRFYTQCEQFANVFTNTEDVAQIVTSSPETGYTNINTDDELFDIEYKENMNNEEQIL